MNCSSCKTPMKSLGQIPIRVGGWSGGWHAVFGGLADVSEDIVLLDFYRCNECKRVEFFDLDLSLPTQK